MRFCTGATLPIHGGNEPQAPGRLSFYLDRPGAGARFASVTGAVRRPRNPISEFALIDKDTGVEYYKVNRIEGDGKCMFRATVRSLAMNKGVFLKGRDELEEADKLRLACCDALCTSSKRRKEFRDATTQIQFGYGELREYCGKMRDPAFWGGEVEMMVLTKMLQIPIYVYRARAESGKGEGFETIIKYGEKFSKPQGKGKKGRRPVRLLFTGGNHYDLLT